MERDAKKCDHGRRIDRVCEACDRDELALPLDAIGVLGLHIGNPSVQRPLEQALAAVKKCGPSREFSIVRQKIEEAILWLKAAERAEFTEHG